MNYTLAVVGQNVKIKTTPLLLSNTRVIANIKKNVVSLLSRRDCASGIAADTH
jgi:hypothetical protein